MKNKTLKAIIGGSVAAVMALSISLPLEANAASNESTVTIKGTSYEQILQYFKQANLEGFPFSNSTIVVTKPQTGTVPNKNNTTTTTTTKPVTKPADTTTVTKPTDNTTTTGAVSNKGTYVQQIVTLVNKERAAAGLSPVAGLDSLHKVAATKATDMRSNNYFSHTSPTYGSPFDMMKSFGITYKAAGENIAMGQKTPEEVMKAWMNSPGHRANILNANFNYIGVGYDNNYWVQEFIGK
ncbi:CAP domain-containing protein [Paenibacillus sp. FSL R10-2778]|uniref:CAP domain-containing protein n=1 Tax=Paenibacillus sp. FSL R10-2778 TaxID=2954659 RepID=UPI0031598D31